jgi:hypothetical protein
VNFKNITDRGSLNILISNYISSTKFVFRYLYQIAKRIVTKRLSRMTSNDHTSMLAEFTLNSASTEDISAPFIEAITSASLNPKRRDKLENCVRTRVFLGAEVVLDGI